MTDHLAYDYFYQIGNLKIHCNTEEKVIYSAPYNNFRLISEVPFCATETVYVRQLRNIPQEFFMKESIFADSRNRVIFQSGRIVRFTGNFCEGEDTSERWIGCAVYKDENTGEKQDSVDDIKGGRSYPQRVTLYVNPGIEEGRKTDGQAKLTDSRLFDALGLDYIMSHNHRVILHSSFISRQGEGILFTAPSGTGKSTQADLWKRHEEGVTIINGDRSILGFKEGRAWVYGLPFCGTSGIAENMDCPLRAVVVLRQGRENQIRRLGQREAFSLLLSECTVNTWDTEGTENIMDLLIRIVRTVPVYYFACLPDFSAVEMLKAALADDYRKG